MLQREIYLAKQLISQQEQKNAAHIPQSCTAVSDTMDTPATKTLTNRMQLEGSYDDLMIQFFCRKRMNDCKVYDKPRNRYVEHCMGVCEDQHFRRFADDYRPHNRFFLPHPH